MSFEDLMHSFDNHTDSGPREGYVKSPFGWPGGKSKSLDHILPHIPYRNTFIEPCGGSGAVLLARHPSNLEIFNDRCSGITDFYLCLQNPVEREELIQRFGTIIHSRELFDRARDTYKTDQTRLERAFRWYYSIIASFGAQGRHFGRATEPPNATGIKLQKKIPLLVKVAPRLARVQIENQDMFRLMDDYDKADVVWYIDPTYYNYSKGMYEYELTKQDHVKLCNRIMELKGFVALSGYPNQLYGQYPWTDVHSWKQATSAAGLAFTDENNLVDDGSKYRKEATECLWIKEAD